MSKIQAIETVGTILMWLGLIGVPVLVYIYAPRFMQRPDDRSDPPPASRDRPDS